MLNSVARLWPIAAGCDGVVISRPLTTVAWNPCSDVDACSPHYTSNNADWCVLVVPARRLLTLCPLCSHAEARAMLTRRRMPSVYDHLQVVLIAQQDTPCDILQELEKLRDVPEPSWQGNPLESGLNYGILEVVAIFTLLPPKSQSLGSGAGLSVWQRVARWVRGLKHAVITRLASWSTFRWGWTVPFRMSLWIQSLVRALDIARTVDVYSPEQHDLQTMCVAKHLQGQGLGSVIVKKIQTELADTDGAVGMQGLCQSEATKNFYVKSGFQAREVYTHSPALSQPGMLRKHWFVAWDVDYKNPHRQRSAEKIK